ncbi:multidrug effflux MFS transporter [Pantoea sp. A4]|uniref:multidrug effflux MFS transporter n=1 Tax=Pantoea sp. A4 TaxID=1225184 RepID=UPI000366DD62|nr:multidrug effflux MFS transporter [Pantoea sp. A4]
MMRNQTVPASTHPGGALFVVILSALMALTSLSTDIYLPAMPLMTADLHGDPALTITGFLMGFAIAQLIWGPISDRYGRRLPLLLGMLLFMIGSAGCALSTDMTQIVFWRVFQALGACTGPMLARAMIRDLFSRSRAAHMLSTLIMVMAVAPIVGPLLGGQMIRFTSWHAIFWLLVALGAVILLAVSLLPETLPVEKRVQTSLRGAFVNYGRLLRNPVFMRYSLGLALYYVAAYAFIAGSPMVYIRYFGVDPAAYGWLFAVNIVGVMVMSMVNRRLVTRFPLDRLLKSATAIAALATLVLLLTTHLHWGGLLMVVVSVFIYFSMNGIVAASSTAAALDEVPEMVGSASALIGALQYGSGILSSLLLAWRADVTPASMVWLIALFTCASALMVNFAGKRRMSTVQQG